jgi:hypothetical protein
LNVFTLPALHVVEAVGKVALRKNAVLLFGREHLAFFPEQPVEILQAAALPGRRFRAAGTFLAPQAAFFQAHFHRVEQGQVVEGLGQVVVGAQVHALAEVVLFGLGRQEDERNGRRVGLFAQQVQHAVAVEFGHHDVTDHQVGQLGPGRLHAPLAVGRRKYLVAGQFEDFGGVLPHVGVVFDDENLLHASG